MIAILDAVTRVIVLAGILGVLAGVVMARRALERYTEKGEWSTGAMEWLERMGHGFRWVVAGAAIVCGASFFDAFLLIARLK